MIGNLQIQTIYVSKEDSSCPLIIKAIEIGKVFEKINLEFNDVILSFKYGKRVLINAEDTKIKELKQEDFLEVVDYDPLKKIQLLIGSKYPKVDTSIHWMIHHARDEINIVLQINDKTLSEKLNFRSTEKIFPQGTLEQAKEILRMLNKSKKIIIKDQGILMTGKDTSELKEMLIKTFEELR